MVTRNDTETGPDIEAMQAGEAVDATASVAKAKRVRVKKAAVADSASAEKDKKTHGKKAAATTTEDAAVGAPVVAKDKKKDKKKEKDKDKNKEKKGKEAVLVRFEREQLAQIDAQATSLGLNRAAWLRMTVAQALAGH